MVLESGWEPRQNWGQDRELEATVLVTMPVLVLVLLMKVLESEPEFVQL